MKSQNRNTSAVYYFLMIGIILTFGIGSALLVLFSPVESGRDVVAEVSQPELHAATRATAAPPEPAAKTPAQGPSVAAKAAAFVAAVQSTIGSGRELPQIAVAPPANASVPPAPAAAASTARASDATAPAAPPEQIAPAARAVRPAEKKRPVKEAKKVAIAEEPGKPQQDRQDPPVQTPDFRATGPKPAPAGGAVASTDSEAPAKASSKVRPALVSKPYAPEVMAATSEKAWVKLDEHRTVTVTKGQAVPGLGVFQGLKENGAARFDAINNTFTIKEAHD